MCLKQICQKFSHYFKIIIWNSRNDKIIMDPDFSVLVQMFKILVSTLEHVQLFLYPNLTT